MGQNWTDRRQLMCAMGGMVAWQGAFGAAAQNASLDVRHDSPSRIPRRNSDDYTPPPDLKTAVDIYSRMNLPVRVNGDGPFPFVVDTGANQSVISAELASQLKLPIGAPSPLNGVAGVENAPTTQASLEVGRRIISGQVLSVLPKAGIGAAGMLGLDAIGNQALTLNFAARELRIETRQSNWLDPDALRAPAHKRDGQLILVDAYLAGMPLTAFIDSGAQNTIGNLALRTHALAHNPKAPWATTTIISSTGQTIMAEIADLPALKIGGVGLPNWPVAFADLHTFQMWNMTRKPAILIGVDILSRFEYVCLDFARDEVRFRLPRGAV